MNDTGTTVYFAGFVVGTTEDDCREIFLEFGNIEKLFIHKTKNYGMVEFDNTSSCYAAINALNQQPPLNLQVNMAKNSATFTKKPYIPKFNNSYDETKPQHYNKFNSSQNSFDEPKPQHYNKFNSSQNSFDEPKPQHYNKFNSSQNSFDEPKSQYPKFNQDEVTYESEDYYMDENNEFVTVFTDPITGEIYVPLRYAPSLKKFTRKVPIKLNDDERSSIKSDSSDRRIKVTKKNDSIANITIQTNVENDHSTKKFDQTAKVANMFDQTSSKSGQMFPRKRFEQNGENRSPNMQTNAQKNFVRPPRQFPKTTTNDVVDRKTFVTARGVQSTQSSNEVKPSSFRFGADKSVSSDKVDVSSIISQSPPKKIVPVQAPVAPKSDVKPPENVLKVVELPNDQFTEVHVENVINESVGWVTLTNKTTDLENLFIKINTLENTEPCALETGKLILAMYEGVWFRAIVLSTAPEIQVRYIDYGNKETITKTDCRELPLEYAKIPAYAICLKLANGAPCKITDDIKIKVKPVGKEEDMVVVHVENGIYEIPETKPPPKKEIKEVVKNVKEDEHLLDLFHKLLTTKLDTESQNIGFIELTISLSKTKFIASFMPLHLTDFAGILQNMKPDPYPTIKVQVGDIVCAENDEGWQRVFITKIENQKYTVAFIDFGTIEEVTEIRPLPKEFINIPLFSCVCSSTDGEDLSQIKDAVDFEIVEVNGNNINCVITVNDKPINVVCVPWDPRTCIPQNNPIKLEEIILKNGEIVRLEMEDDGFLFVRNKQAAEIRKKIDQFMAQNGSKAPSVNGKPSLNQLVTAKYDGDYYRAIIKSINPTNNNVTVCYIDYGNEETLPYNALKTLDEQMMKDPISIIKIRLKNFINKPFSVKALDYLEKLSQQKIILKASFDESPENGYDLKTPDGSSISDELEKLDGAVPKPKSFIKHIKPEKPAIKEENEFYKSIKIPNDDDPKVFMSNVPLQEIPLGETEIVFQQFSIMDDDILSVAPNNPEILHKVQVEMQQQMLKYVQHSVPNQQYKPEIEECVLVQSEGKWYRGACTSEPENDEYSIFLIDYGSLIQFSSKDMRRMPQEFAKDKALSNFARFDGLPETANDNVRNRLKDLLERNNIYPVNVVEKNEIDECYIIQFTSVLQILKKEKLI